MIRTTLALAVVGLLVACGSASGTASPSASATSPAPPSPSTEAQAATGVCRAFYVNGGVDLAEAAFVDELTQAVSGGGTSLLIDPAARAFAELAAETTGDPSEDLAALADQIRTSNSSDGWYDALTRFEERYGPGCGLDS